MALFDGLVVIGIIGGIGVVIWAKLIQKNPKLKEFAKDISINNIVEKIPMKNEVPDKIQQVYDERRTMM